MPYGVKDINRQYLFQFPPIPRIRTSKKGVFSMIQVDEMENSEITAMLATVNYGHLGLSLNNQPYVVPVHYAFEEPFIYLYTTDGKKSDIIRRNSRVCLQIEDVVDKTKWKSVIIEGSAERIAERKELEHAITLLLEVNPTLSPAISIRWVDNWIRENREIVYRIKPDVMTGRMTSNVESMATNV
jgi:uncharacterized protein